MDTITAALKAGAYQHAAELLALYRAGELNSKNALLIILSSPWNYGESCYENV